MNQAIRQVMIRGRVQGVGYRAWVVQQATGRELEGWVRNRKDGCVEALFAGPPDVVTELVTLCRRGPSSARVVTVHDEAGHSDALGLRQLNERFSLLPTI